MKLTELNLLMYQTSIKQKAKRINLWTEMPGNQEKLSLSLIFKINSLICSVLSYFDNGIFVRLGLLKGKGYAYMQYKRYHPISLGQEFCPLISQFLASFYTVCFSNRRPLRQKRQRHEIQAEIRLLREKNSSIASLNSELHHELKEVNRSSLIPLFVMCWFLSSYFFIRASCFSDKVYLRQGAFAARRFCYDVLLRQHAFATTCFCIVIGPPF